MFIVLCVAGCIKHIISKTNVHCLVCSRFLYKLYMLVRVRGAQKDQPELLPRDVGAHRAIVLDRPVTRPTKRV
jgi:hypothetical protein